MGRDLALKVWLEGICLQGNMDLGHAASKLVSVVSKWAPTVPVCSHSGEEEGNGT